MYEIFTIPVTPFAQNARILACPVTRKAVVVDPGGEPQRILREVERHSLIIEQIWLTHSHLDHCGAVAGIRRAVSTRLLGHRAEADLRRRVVQLGALFGMRPGDLENCPEPDQYLEGGERVSFSDYEFEVFFAPGHSPGHLCFYHPESKTVLVGDVLFRGSIGRTDLEGGSYEVLMHSIHEVLLKLPPDTRVLSGHGPDTTLEHELATNPFLQGRDVEIN